jgi:hypothetical protein
MCWLVFTIARWHYLWLFLGIENKKKIKMVYDTAVVIFKNGAILSKSAFQELATVSMHSIVVVEGRVNRVLPSIRKLADTSASSGLTHLKIWFFPKNVIFKGLEIYQDMFGKSFFIAADIFN